MQSNRETLLCDYRYDPLDRLTVCTQSEHQGTQRFYLQTRLATEVQGTVQRSIIHHQDQLLAQQQRENGAVETTLLATDQQRSVLIALDTTGPRAFAYAPYGHRIAQNGLLSLLGFNGERPDPVTGHYLLGNGYRAFNPVLMRFNSPDSWSPFGEGGLNTYVYCGGDSVNRRDDTGHAPGLLAWLMKSFGKAPGNAYNAPRHSNAQVPSDHPRTVPSSKIKNVETTIKAIQRNKIKLDKANSKLNKFSEDQFNIYNKIKKRNIDTANEFGSEEHDTMVHNALRKRREKLENKILHYTKKISTLEDKFNGIRHN